MTGHFEQVCTFSWIWNEDPSEQVPGMRCYIFGESEGSGNNVFVQQVDVVAFWICWVVIEWQIASEHGVL
jgi:hypothetical protein